MKISKFEWGIIFFAFMFCGLLMGGVSGHWLLGLLAGFAVPLFMLFLKFLFDKFLPTR